MIIPKPTKTKPLPWYKFKFIEDFKKWYRLKRMQLNSMKWKEFWSCQKPKTREELLLEIDEKIKKHMKEFLENKKQYFTGKAFVTFEYEDQSKNTLEKLLGHDNMKIWQKYGLKLPYTEAYFTPKLKPEEQTIVHKDSLSEEDEMKPSMTSERTSIPVAETSAETKPRRLKIVRPHEPVDILWENLDVDNWCDFLWRRFVSASCTVLILLVSFGIIYGCTLMQQDIN